MNLLPNSILYFYSFLLTSAVYKNRVEVTNAPDVYNSTATEQATSTTQTDDKETKQPVLMKMLLIANNNDGCSCHCSKDEHNRTTAKVKKSPLGFKVVMRNKPAKYPQPNSTIGRLCPYFVPNEGFRMFKMAGIFWPKFYNLKEDLGCFKINVLRLNEMQMKENELKYGNFSGKVDWSQCHFEIKPPELFLRKRHFLLGGINDRGVMRNIMISYNTNGGYSLNEEAPDQWLMLRNLVLLRDCTTGEVVVFTRSPHQTTSADIVQALQYLGEEMIGKMLCDEDDDWLEQAS